LMCCDQRRRPTAIPGLISASRTESWTQHHPHLIFSNASKSPKMTPARGPGFANQRSSVCSSMAAVGNHRYHPPCADLRRIKHARSERSLTRARHRPSRAP
jgi:hypothetical protein